MNLTTSDLLASLFFLVFIAIGLAMENHRLSNTLGNRLLIALCIGTPIMLFFYSIAHAA